jgi:hypothetical protein
MGVSFLFWADMGQPWLNVSKQKDTPFFIYIQVWFKILALGFIYSYDLKIIEPEP